MSSQWRLAGARSAADHSFSYHPQASDRMFSSTNSHSNSSSSSGSSRRDHELHNDTRHNDSSSIVSPIGSGTISGPYRTGNSDGGTCSYHTLVAGESCRHPRTCYECLNVNVVDVSTGCLLAPSGFCEDMSSYDGNLDFRRNTTSEDLSLTGWYNYFPSINTTYCEATDKACMLCDELVNNGSLGQALQFKNENGSIEMERQFCRGADGCVCIMACESDHWKANMPVDCDTDGSSWNNTKASSADATTYSSMLVFCLVLQVVLLAFFMYKRGLCRPTIQPPPPRPEGPYNNVNAITSPSNRLRLSGWRKMQNTLIEREKKQRAVQQPQYMTSPRVEAGGAQAQLPLSPQTSARNSGSAEAAYTQVQDDSRLQTNSLPGSRQAASVDSNVVVVEGPYEERITDAGTERTSSLVAMLEADRDVA